MELISAVEPQWDVMNLPRWCDDFGIDLSFSITKYSVGIGLRPTGAEMSLFGVIHNPYFAIQRVMIAQRLGFTRDFSPEWNSGSISVRRKIPCGAKEQARARVELRNTGSYKGNIDVCCDESI